MKVLILDEWIPFPLISGKRLRSYNLLSRAASEHDITYLCFADPDTDRVAREHMESLGMRIVTLPRRDPFTPAYKLYALAALNAPSRWPLVMRKHFRRDYLSKLQEVVAAEKFDLIHCEWTHYGAYARLVPGLPRFLSSHNIEAMPWERLYRHETNPVKRGALFVEWKKMVAFERDICRSFHHISAVSEDDRNKFVGDYGCQSVSVTPNGVDVSYYDAFLRAAGPVRGAGAPVGAPGAGGTGGPLGALGAPGGGGDATVRTLVFSASFDAFVNQDAVLYWMEAVWPRLRNELPAARTLFLGKDPPPTLTKYASDRVWFTGTVTDVRPYLALSSVCIVPLRVAGGSRIKILEAMATGLPVVSTPEGAEGLDVVSGQHLLIARDADEFVNAISRLLQDEGMARYLTENGRRLVEERYDWQNIAELIPMAWQETVRRFERLAGR